MTSIRRRLLVWLLLALGTGLAGGGGAVYLAARDTASEMADLHMRQIAGALPSRSFSPINVLSKEDAQDERIVVQIWNRAGNVLYVSDRAQGSLPRGQNGFATVVFEGSLWRTYNEEIGDNHVQVAQPASARTAMAARMALRSVWPLMVVTPFLGLAILLTVKRGLEPLQRIAHQVERRSAESLDPLSTANTPDEVLALAGALNRLLERLSHAFDTQRAFVADAAHELRTPLAALKLQTQLAERAENAADRAAAFATLHGGIGRAAHLVQQLLDLARQEETGRNRAPVHCALDALVREAVSERAALALERGIDLGVARGEVASIEGNAASLSTLIGNLIDNALNYTPSGGRVDVESAMTNGGAVLTVSDTGPGIAPEHRERVFDRFYRIPGTRKSGSGLGLSIVQGAASAHGASIALDDNPGGGLRVTVRFPVAEMTPQTRVHPDSAG